MSEIEQSSEGINWYKIATILLSVAMLILTFISIVYYRHLLNVQQRAKIVNDKIIELQERLTYLEKIPKVTIDLITLQGSGLPEFAFSRMKSVPAVVTIKHITGETARGITTKISSETNIFNVFTGESIEPFTYEVSEDKRSVVFDIPQLRRGSSVQATLMQRGLGALKHETRIDVGEIGDWTTTIRPLFFTGSKWAEGLPEKRFKFASIRNIKEVEEIDPAEMTRTEEIKNKLVSLKIFRKIVKSEPFLSLSLSKFGSFGEFLIAALGTALFGILVMPLLHDLSQWPQNKKVLAAAEGERTLLGLKTSEIEEILGKWDRRIYRVHDSEQYNELWYYPCKKIIFPRKALKSAAVCFSEGKAVQVYYASRKTRPGPW